MTSKSCIPLAFGNAILKDILLQLVALTFFLKKRKNILKLLDNFNPIFWML